MNSRLFDFVYKLGNPQTKKVFAEIKPSVVKQLPIRTIDFTNPADVARHDQMVKFVERMLELHQQKQSAANENARERIAREIALTDEKIDALVYELYGLTQAEIDLVEGRKERGR